MEKFSANQAAFWASRLSMIKYSTIPSWPFGIPQEVPLLNALDCWMSYCIMILVAGSALYLEPINKVGRDGWYSGTRWVEQCFRLQRARNCGRFRRQFHHWRHGAFNSHSFNGPNAKKKKVMNSKKTEVKHLIQQDWEQWAMNCARWQITLLSTVFLMLTRFWTLLKKVDVTLYTYFFFYPVASN